MVSGNEIILLWFQWPSSIRQLCAAVPGVIGEGVWLLSRNLVQQETENWNGNSPHGDISAVE